MKYKQLKGGKTGLSFSFTKVLDVVNGCILSKKKVTAKVKRVSISQDIYFSFKPQKCN